MKKPVHLRLKKCRKCELFKDCILMTLFSFGFQKMNWHKKHCLKKRVGKDAK